MIVLDDGSKDETEAARRRRRAEMTRASGAFATGQSGQGRATQRRFRAACNELVVVIDADAHLQPQAIRCLVRRIQTSPMLVAVAGAPHVTNRNRLI